MLTLCPTIETWSKYLCLHLSTYFLCVLHALPSGFSVPSLCWHETLEARTCLFGLPCSGEMPSTFIVTHLQQQHQQIRMPQQSGKRYPKAPWNTFERGVRQIVLICWSRSPKVYGSSNRLVRPWHSGAKYYSHVSHILCVISPVRPSQRLQLKNIIFLAWAHFPWRLEELCSECDYNTI